MQRLIPHGICDSVGLMAASALGQAAATISQARGSYTCSGGLCKGDSDKIIGIFAGLQRAINVVLSMHGQGSIVVDGRIGDETQKGAGLVLTILGEQFSPALEWIASNAEQLAKRFAAYSKTSTNFSMPSVTRQRPPQTDVAVTQNELPEPMSKEGEPQIDGKKGLHWGWWAGGALLLAGAGYLGYRMFSGKGTFAGAIGDGDEEIDHGYGEAGEDFIDV